MLALVSVCTAIPETPEFSSLNDLRTLVREALADLPSENFSLRIKSANTLGLLSISRREN